MLTEKNPDKKINMFAGYCQEIRHLKVGPLAENSLEITHVKGAID